MFIILCACFTINGYYVASMVLTLIRLNWYPNLLEGADNIGEQMRRDKECPFSSGSLEEGNRN